MNAPVRIAELARLLHPRSSRWRVMAMLHAYFDESGTHDASVVTAIGGYIATEADWTALEAEWQPILDEHAYLGVTHFHLSHCLMNSGEFSLCATPIMTGVVQDDWDELNDGGPFFQAFPTPVALCFENLVRELARWAKTYADGEKIAPVFAYRQEWASGHGLGGPILQLYGSQDWYKQTLAMIGFDWPQHVIPLQAADLFAGLARRDLERRSAPNPWPEQAIHWATGSKYMHGTWFGYDALKITIERFNETGEIYSMS